MSEFTYQTPNEGKYYEAVIRVLSTRNKAISDKLKNGYCTISDSSSYSQKRWNGMRTTVYFYVPIAIFEEISPAENSIILQVCDMVMPKEVGFDVTNVEIAPILDSISAEDSLNNDLEKISQNESYALIQNLPDDIKEKGTKMSEVYGYLYCIENTLRLFIEKIGVQNNGADFISHLTISGSVRRKIALRKEEEEKNQWLCIRGNCDLFYLDFKELGDIIVNNWEIFKTFFPEQAFVTSKINELARCRNLVAHNSLITNAERDLLRLYYNQFLSQINGTRHE